MTIGLAVSGGGDSVALMALLAPLREELGFAARVLHFNHGLGIEVGEDASFVRSLARRFRYPFTSGKGKTIRQKGESLEMAARRVRLEFFARCTARFGLDAIATAHQMDDAAETFLMRVARGSSPEGLAGMREISKVDTAKGPVVFIRPLLGLRGADLRTYLRENSIPWKEDATNADLSILRNRVRRVVIPFLRENLDPHIVPHAAKCARLLREECAACFTTHPSHEQ